MSSGAALYTAQQVSRLCCWQQYLDLRPRAGPDTLDLFYTIESDVMCFYFRCTFVIGLSPQPNVADNTCVCLPPLKAAYMLCWDNNLIPCANRYDQSRRTTLSAHLLLSALDNKVAW